VIVDVVLRNADGLELTAELKTRYPIPVLVFSTQEESLYAVRAFRVGASGYVSKRETEEVVLVAIRCVLAGEIWMSDALRRELAVKYVRGRTIETDSPLHTLSKRELHIFRLIGEGRTTRQIAGLLSRSVKTVESHIEHIKDKMSIRSAAELAQRATRWVETGRSN
jgi:DNA-binding NarL/FixJ family response regulator